MAKAKKGFKLDSTAIKYLLFSLFAWACSKLGIKTNPSEKTLSIETLCVGTIFHLGWEGERANGCHDNLQNNIMENDRRMI